jgi:hypothetical protein
MNSQGRTAMHYLFHSNLRHFPDHDISELIKYFIEEISLITLHEEAINEFFTAAKNGYFEIAGRLTLLH